MLGSFGGNVVAILYFLLYQFCGLMLAERFLQTEKKTLRLLAGSVLGSVLLQWMPVLFAFVLDFTSIGHVVAAITTVIIAILLRRKERPLTVEKSAPEWKYAVLPMAVWCVFAYLVISGFEIRDGAVYSSQATYGDMAMHLGFITSIAEQQTFPPEYSILPGTRLSYPFLSDSISSSLYVWGCDIRLSYMLPMLFAGAQVIALGSVHFRLRRGARARQSRSGAEQIPAVSGYSQGGRIRRRRSENRSFRAVRPRPAAFGDLSRGKGSSALLERFSPVPAGGGDNRRRIVFPIRQSSGDRS